MVMSFYKVHSMRFSWALMAAMAIMWGTSVKADSVNLSPLEVTLGEPVTLILKGKNIESDFAQFDKEKIRQHFEVYDVDGDSNYMRLVLYPRRVGEAAFPAIHIGGLQFNGEVVKVKPNDEVQIEWQPPKNDAYLNQLHSWKALVKTSDPSLSVRMLLHPHANNKVTHLMSDKSLGENQQWSGSQRIFIMLVSGNQLGKAKVRSPVIQVQNSGNGQPWLFFDDTQWIHVKPLPSFIPTFVPNGEVSVHASLEQHLVATGSLVHWHLSLSGRQIPVEQLPNFASQIDFQTAIEWLTPEIKKSQTFDLNGLESRLEIDQPFRLQKVGLYQLPALRVTYFDSETGKLKDAFLPSKWIVSVPSWTVILVQVLVIFALLMAAFMVLSLFLEWLIKQRLLIQLRGAKTDEQVWISLLDWTTLRFHLSQVNITFGQWQNLVDAQFGESEAALQLVDNLNKTNFSEARLTVQPQAIAWAQQLPVLNVKSSFKFGRTLLVEFAKRIAVFFKRNAKAVNQ